MPWHCPIWKEVDKFNSLDSAWETRVISLSHYFINIYFSLLTVFIVRLTYWSETRFVMRMWWNYNVHMWLEGEGEKGGEGCALHTKHQQGASSVPNTPLLVPRRLNSSLSTLIQHSCVCLYTSSWKFALWHETRRRITFCAEFLDL